tara:strand:- start:2338 stop:6585 length:4248 start_codon:yes stop_codon:yes gene_type:complete
MLSLPTVYKLDISGTLTNVDYILVINTDPKIRIASNASNLISATEGIPEEFIAYDFTYENLVEDLEGLAWGTESTNAIIDTYEELYPPLWEFAQSIVDWCDSDTTNTTPSTNIYGVIHQMLVSWHGTFSPIYNWDENSYWNEGNPPPFGSQSQEDFEQWWVQNMGITIPGTPNIYTYEYYEDRDLSVSGISESIDLKNKKFKIGTVNVSLTNISVGGKIFSDVLADTGIGVEVQIYQRTRAAKKLSDCLKVFDGRIQRYKHNINTVSLELEDTTMKKMHKTLPLPEYTFYSDNEVFEQHIGKPIPILYGHLEKAPSILYTSSTLTEDMYNNNNIFAMYDNAPLADHSVRGSKLIYPPGTQEDIETGVLYIKSGDNYLEIPHRAYSNLPDEVLEAHNYPQYELSVGENGGLQGEYLKLITNNPDTGKTLLGDFNVIWCHYLDYPISRFYLQGYADTDHVTHHGGAWNRYHNYLNYENYNKYNWRDSDAPSTLYDINRGVANGDSNYAQQSFVNIFTDSCAINFNFEPFSVSGEQYREVDPADGKEKLAVQGLAIVGKISLFFQKDSGNWSRICHDRTQFLAADDEKPINYFLVNYFPFAVHHNPYSTNSWNYSEYFDMRNGENLPMVNAPACIENIHQNEQHAPILSWNVPGNYPSGIRVSGEQAYGNGTMSDGEHATNYRHYFTRDRSGDLGIGWKLENNWISGGWHDRVDQDYPQWDIDSNTLGVVVVPKRNDGFGYNLSFPWFNKSKARVSFDHLAMRRYFNLTEGLAQDFYINAVGRDDNDNYTFTEDGKKPMRYDSSHLKILYAFDDNMNNELRAESEHNMFYLLYEYMQNPAIQSRYVDNNREILAIKVKIMGSNTRLYFLNPRPIHVNYKKQSTSADPNFLEMFIDADVYAVSGGQIINVFDWSALDTVQMSSQQTLNFVRFDSVENTIETTWELSDMHDVLLSQSPDDEGTAMENATNYPEEGRGFFEISSEYLSKPRINRPSEIIHHLLLNELDYNKGINNSKFMESARIHKDWQMAFSVNEPADSKSVIENICRQSKLASVFRVATGEFSFANIDEEYSDSNVNRNIDTRDLISISTERTKSEDVVTKCRVLYGYDYSDNGYKKATPFVQSSNFASYVNQYGFDNVDDNIEEVECKYIQDEVTALLFRDYYFNIWKNQHDIVKCRLPLSYSDLEVSDVVKFSVHEDFKFKNIYGKSIDENYIKIDQEIYPYFMITKIRKNNVNIEMELFRLHKLNYPPSQIMGVEDDVIVGEGQVDDIDIIIPDIPLPLDINGDGQLDVLDVILILNHMLGIAELTPGQILMADINGDGDVDVMDIVAILAWILNPEAPAIPNPQGSKKKEDPDIDFNPFEDVITPIPGTDIDAIQVVDGAIKKIKPLPGHPVVDEDFISPTITPKRDLEDQEGIE